MPDPREKIHPEWFAQAKARGERIATLTAYDYPTARLLDEAGLPLILVGDSLGMVVLGYPDTTHVTLEHIAHHVNAVARAAPVGLLVADLPYRTYESPEQAVASAQRLIEAGAEAVKLEGGRNFLPQVDALRQASIPVMGHLGMLPQSVLEEGGYKKKGRTPEQRDQLIANARALETAGVFAIVLELVMPETATAISQALRIPTIGIGSGAGSCDGNILVTHDLIGFYPWFTPKFVQPKGDAAGEIRRAVAAYQREVAAGLDSLTPSDD